MVELRGVKVPPLSREKICQNAEAVRAILGLSGGVKVVDVIELVLPQLLPDFVYSIESQSVMDNDHARTFPDKREIQIREDVYDRAASVNWSNCSQYGRDNFTLAHEIGHLVLHTNVAAFSRADHLKGAHQIYEDSEWQADTFAAEFLMPLDQVRECRTIDEVQRRFLVSYKAANFRYVFANKKASQN